MRRNREILRLTHKQGLSHREMAWACVIGPGTDSRDLRKTVDGSIGLPPPPDLDGTTHEA